MSELVPDFLSDLTFTLNGMRWRAFEVPESSAPQGEYGYIMFGFREPRSWKYGLCVNEYTDQAQIKTMTSLRRYEYGAEVLYTAWDGSEDRPYPEDAEAFDQWVRRAAITEIYMTYIKHVAEMIRIDAHLKNQSDWRALCHECRSFLSLEDEVDLPLRAGLQLLGCVSLGEDAEEETLRARAVSEQFATYADSETRPFAVAFFAHCRSIVGHMRPTLLSNT